MENIKHTQDKSQEHEETIESQESGLEQVVEEKTESVEKETETQENKDTVNQNEQKIQDILRFELKYSYLMSEPIQLLADSFNEKKIFVSFPKRFKVNFQRSVDTATRSIEIRQKIQKLNKNLESPKKWYQSEKGFNEKKEKIKQEISNLQKQFDVYEDNIKSDSIESETLKKLEVLDLSEDFYDFQDYSNIKSLPAKLDSLKTLVDKAKEFYTKKIENHQ